MKKMRLHIDGEINRTYCQNLCLIFFPGAKFPENEPQDSSVPEAYIRLWEEGEYALSEATIIDGERKETGYGKAHIPSFISHNRAIKTAVGEAMLEAGTRLLGTPPQWGIVIGVRPAKVAAEMRGRGLDKEAIVSKLMSEFHLFENKARLLAEVNEREERAAALAKENTCSLYVSVPFCPTRCAYCSFVSYSTPRYLSMLPEYLDTLCLDVEDICREIRERGEELLTVYIGGGTPTTLDERQLERLLKTINRSIGDTKILEFTVEAGRPDTVTSEKFEIMVANGVDRTSINPQILDDGVLRAIGRGHSVSDFYSAYEIAKKSGIRSVNTDLIAGLPTSDFGIFSKTVDEIVKLSPENITVHTYCVKRAAEFTEKVNTKKEKIDLYSYSDSETSSCVEYSQEVLYKNGYRPYYLYRQRNSRGNLENVGFSKEGYDGLYNIFIMEELHNIYAVGAGAVTKLVGGKNDKIKRIFEPKYSYEYLKQHKNADK